MRGLLALIVFAFCVPSAQAATVSIERHPMPATKYGDSSYALLILSLIHI